VLNGYVRDTKAILNMSFPTFGFGSYGQDPAPRYKVVDFRIPVEIGTVRVRPGDVLFGDVDGSCWFPPRLKPRFSLGRSKRLAAKSW